MNFTIEQKTICKKYGAQFCESSLHLKIGISKNVKNGILPINGLRHQIEENTTGWYIWAGEEFSTDKDFFMPLHVEHLNTLYPEILKYLGLAPGWRFLLAEDYEDVWQDLSLLDIG